MEQNPEQYLWIQTYLKITGSNKCINHTLAISIADKAVLEFSKRFTTTNQFAIPIERNSHEN